MLRTTTRGLATSARRAYAVPARVQQQVDSARQWKGTSVTGANTLLLSNGEFVEGNTDRYIDVNDPSTQEVLTRVPEFDLQSANQLVDGAEAAFHLWKDSSVLKRQDVMLK